MLGHWSFAELLRTRFFTKPRAREVWGRASAVVSATEGSGLPFIGQGEGRGWWKIFRPWMAFEVIRDVSFRYRGRKRMRTVAGNTVQHVNHANAGLGTDHGPKQA